MTKQEKIRAWISHYLTDIILEYLHSQGLMLKVAKERILGYSNYNGLTRESDIRFEIAIVEPLIRRNDKLLAELDRQGYVERDDILLKTQADISFMGGIKLGRGEVVEWVNEHEHCGSAGGASHCIAIWEWQAQLKEWGL